MATCRQRILKALSHRQPDRCATYTWLDAGSLAVLEAHLHVQGLDAVENALRIDRWRDVGIGWEPPEDFDERICRFVPGRFRRLDAVSITPEGRVLKSHPEADYLEDVIWNPLQNVGDVRQLAEYPFPDPDRMTPIAELQERIRQLKASDAFVVGGITQPFKSAWILRGFENFLCDLAINSEIAAAVYERLYRYIAAQGVAYAKAGVDMVQIVGDIAMQDRLMMSPDTWRRYDKPRLAELVRNIKTVNSGVYVGMHSDGCMTDIVPDLIEVGIEILNPIQPECMNPYEVKRRWGDRLVLHGCVSIQRTIPFGTPDDVRDEVRRLVDACGRNGGLVLGPANVLMKEFPVENVVAMYDAIAS